MLAYDPGVVVGYATGPIFASLAAAFVLIGAGFAAASRPEKGMLYLGGMLAGVGVVTLHYIGMTGVIIPGRLEWNTGLVALSAIYSVVFATLALIAVRRMSENAGLWCGTLALVVGVVLLHFTGMGALTIVPDPSVAIPESQLPPSFLVLTAALITAFIISVSVICIVFDRHIAREQKQAQTRIHHMAYHDSLTGLPNRAFLADVMHKSLAEAGARGEEAAVIAIDLDRFKQVNDIFGHHVGDALLKKLAEVMQAELSPLEFLARVGGDEFVVVQTGAAQPNAAAGLAERLISAVNRDFDIGGTTLRAAMSLGIALYPRDGEDAAIVYPNADAALYRAKEEGRNCFRVFEPAMDLQLRARRALQMEMRDALKRAEFKLFYQPQAETLTGVISGFEALLRWEHPSRGIVLPSEFIPAAEDNGFIVELGEFVLRSACTEAASWKKPLNIAVNLSPVQFQHGDLVDLVRNVLADTGLDPARLELEVTESVLILDFDRAVGMLHEIKALGVCIAMDDFGTGYSSLAYLQAFPFDRIKIDKSFIAKLHENEQSDAIVRAIIGLGRGLDVPITAEGVETEAQQAFLAGLDCAEIQGFLIGRPQPIHMLRMLVGTAEEADAVEADKAVA